MNNPTAKTHYFDGTKGSFLRLVPQSATLDFQDTVERKEWRAIMMTLRLGRRQQILAPDGQSIGDVDWSLHLFDGEGYTALVDRQQEVGRLMPGFEAWNESTHSGFHINAVLKPERFATLFDIVLRGRLPREVCIFIPGLKSELVRGKTGIVLDKEAQSSWRITEIGFNAPLIVPSEGPTDRAPPPLATGADIQSLEARLVAIERTNSMRWTGLILMLIVGMLLLFFRR